MLSRRAGFTTIIAKHSSPRTIIESKSYGGELINGIAQASFGWDEGIHWGVCVSDHTCAETAESLHHRAIDPLNSCRAMRKQETCALRGLAVRSHPLVRVMAFSLHSQYSRLNSCKYENS